MEKEYFIDGSRNPDTGEIRMGWDETVTADHVNVIRRGNARTPSRFAVSGNVVYTRYGDIRPMPGCYADPTFLHSLD